MYCDDPDESQNSVVLLMKSVSWCWIPRITRFCTSTCYFEGGQVVPKICRIWAKLIVYSELHDVFPFFPQMYDATQDK